MRSLSKWMLKAEALNSRPPSLRLSSLVTAESKSIWKYDDDSYVHGYMATCPNDMTSESGDLTWPKIIMPKSKLVTYAYWNRFKIPLLHTNSHQKSYSTSIHLLLASSQTAVLGPTEVFFSKSQELFPLLCHCHSSFDRAESTNWYSTSLIPRLALFDQQSIYLRR